MSKLTTLIGRRIRELDRMSRHRNQSKLFADQIRSILGLSRALNTAFLQERKALSGNDRRYTTTSLEAFLDDVGSGLAATNRVRDYIVEVRCFPAIRSKRFAYELATPLYGGSIGLLLDADVFALIHLAEPNLSIGLAATVLVHGCFYQIDSEGAHIRVVSPSIRFDEHKSTTAIVDHLLDGWRN